MLPRLLLLSAVVIWGWTFVATKVLVAEIGPLEIFALRLAIGLPFLGAVVLLKRVPLRFARADALPLVILLVSDGNPARLGSLHSTGDWLVIASAHTWAIYTVVTRDLVGRRDPLAVTFGILLIAATLTAILFIASGDATRVQSLSPRGVAALLYLAIPGLALGQWFWQEGVSRLGVTRAGVYLFLEPLATLALAIPLLGERFGAVTAVGGGLVLAGVYLGQRKGT